MLPFAYHWRSSWYILVWHVTVLEIKRYKSQLHWSQVKKRDLINTMLQQQIWRNIRKAMLMVCAHAWTCFHVFVRLYLVLICVSAGSVCAFWCLWMCVYQMPVCVDEYDDMCVSPSACQRHSPSLSPRLTVTGRDPSNYLFLDHMQMAELSGEQRLAGAAWVLPTG